MKRLKTFFIYALVIAAFWFLSDILIYLAINGTYKPIETKVIAEVPNVNVAESKATLVNGYVKGNIYNNSNKTINNKYVKMDFYSQRDVYLGTKYVKIENLEEGKTTNFEMWFKFENVEYCNITITDDTTNSTEEQFLSEETKFAIVVGTLLVLYFI